MLALARIARRTPFVGSGAPLFGGRARSRSSIAASALGVRRAPVGGAPRLGLRRRGLSAVAARAPDDDSAWEAAFIEATEGVRSDATHADSAAALRRLDKLGLLKHTDIRDRPERFFQAHRLLARHAVQHGPGFWIRFTVHHNLCYGTVVAVGSEAQQAELASFQAEGELGCFALTEKLAGVQSGLVVQTTADYNVDSKQFVINTPSEGAMKNWISQGHVADRAVVLADLRVDGKSKGPHAFFVQMRKAGALVDGIRVGDMGVKTTGNDLDNAWIAFDQLKVPHDSLLNAHCSVDAATGSYSLKSASVRPFEMIGQRLYTGRVAVAQAALAYCHELFRVTQAYADAKKIPNLAHLSNPKALSSIPQLKALFAEAKATSTKLDAFLDSCEAKLAPLLRAGLSPDAQLAHSIATAKVKAVELSIDLCGRLKQEVGSYALMGTSGFVHLDFLNCCKFAEGDSRILMQKMTRDRLRSFAKEPAGDGEEARLCAKLAKAMAAAGSDKARQADIWDEEWLDVYALAEAIMQRTFDDALR